MSGSGEADRAAESGARVYQLVCLGALAVLLLALVQRGLTFDLVMAEPWAVLALLPVLAGAVGLLFRWRAAPVLLLLTLTGAVWYWDGRYGPPSDQVADLFLCAGALAYVVGYYRLQGMVKFLFPRDPRPRPGPPGLRPGQPRRHRWTPPEPPPARSPGLATAGEFVWFLAALPAWPVLGLLAERLLVSYSDFAGPEEPFSPESMWARVWPFRLLIWAGVTGVLVVSGLLGYLAWGRRTPAEAALLVQDVVWRETAWEQRRLASWRAWFRRTRKGEDS
jgi:hypothetical protein